MIDRLEIRILNLGLQLETDQTCDLFDMSFSYVSYLAYLGLVGAHPSIRFLHACLQCTVQALNLHLVKRGGVFD